MDPYYFSLAHLVTTDPRLVSIPAELGYTAKEWFQKSPEERFEEARSFIIEFHRGRTFNVPYYIVNFM